MLKSNSKKAIESIRTYIMDNFTPEMYDESKKDFKSFEEVADCIFHKFEIEKGWDKRSFANEQDNFVDWAQGLPGILDCCYFYNRSAVEDLGNILEETEEEKSKYTELEAGKMLSKLIYREISKGKRKYRKERAGIIQPFLFCINRHIEI